jgi:hypothetical protein
MIWPALSVFLFFTGSFLVFWLPWRNLDHLMDPRGEPGGFEPHLKRYQDLARLILTLATAALAFLVNLIVNPPANRASSEAGPRLLNAALQAILLLCAAIFFLLLFMTLLNFFYENFSHFYYLPPSSPAKKAGIGLYRRWKYALVLSSGYSGLLSFFAAFAYLALTLARH